MASDPIPFTFPPGATSHRPTRNLGEHGMDLWDRIIAEYEISDAAGRELLTLACQAIDRAEALRALIDAEGEVVTTPRGVRDHPGLRHELAARAFVAKALNQLGLTMEPLRPFAGRPVGPQPTHGPRRAE